ncbi:hypothetical protein CC80DRAFT_518698 [Byssothecium circinans]|uniref:Flap structure-specific endonuclease n=1 Tax=Byssothecium circinans TaxID=147558 RepID=A0A6A5TJT6_9PLEO|nr:hypothetical protein CC80DRAFT_518698 [Byssothecium circinans]
MGIHGIYKEIGPGQRIALSKLAVEKFEETGRPLRIAIDTSIWLFQIQASKGGTNPALRTFYYRLLRLISLSIHPIFVFDGPNKPPFKRNKRTGPNVASIPEFLAKQLLKQFGFPMHLAPGEAEAECALLQREGIVDAVLSEDVDTLMFGSSVTIRNWSPEQKTGKTPTHVNVYDAAKTKAGPAGLDREGMILIALMSGGDYIPEGIPGVGPKLACEAARAGFGHDLCKIPRNDKKAMREWRDRLEHEIKTNESKLFSRKKPSLKMPDSFPQLDILGYYTHPAVSSQAGLDKLRQSINWDQDLDFPGLRAFAHDAFDWVKLEGAKHFIRSLAPSLLVRHLRMRGDQPDRFPSDDVQAIEEDEALIVKGIHGKRQHDVTDCVTELRLSFIPIELVRIDLDTEEPDDDFDAAPSTGQDDDMDEELPLEFDDDAEGPKKRGPTKFDPNKPVRAWVLETFVKIGVPLKAEDWEAAQKRKEMPKAKRPASANDASKAAPKPRGARRAKTTNDASQATMERFAKVTKPGAKLSRALAKALHQSSDPPAPSKAPLPTQSFVNLLSSPPPEPTNTIRQPSREKTLSPVLEDLPLPSSVTKRRRRAPIQRSHTLPAHPTIRPDTPPLDMIDSLDFANSPIVPSPSQLPSKKPRTQGTKTVPARTASVAPSPGKNRQTTLDAWRSPLATPTKSKSRKDADSAAEPRQPKPAPPQFRVSSTDGVETFDLTLSSPIQPLLAPPPTKTKTTTPPTPPRRTIADVFAAAGAAAPARPPLVSISSNASRASPTSPSTSTSRGSSRSSKPKPTSKNTSCTNTTTARRTSPRLRKTKSLSPEIESVDLTKPSPPHPPPPPPQPMILPVPQSKRPPLALTQTSARTRTTTPLRTNPPAPAPSPSRTPTLSPTPSPPVLKLQPRKQKQAAWKQQAKKKRQVVLRDSLAGAWTFTDAESPGKSSPGGELKTGDGDGEGDVVLKGKARRRWRESEIEKLDLTKT